jgi:uncharacterized protein (TIGR02117 family)
MHVQLYPGTPERRGPAIESERDAHGTGQPIVPEYAGAAVRARDEPTMNLSTSPRIVRSLILCMSCVSAIVTACTDPGPSAGQDAKTGETSVYLVNHGWHAGIVLERSLLSLDPELSTTLPRAGRFVEVGWGDAGYYRSQDPSLWVTLKGAFWPTRSVLHVTVVEAAPLDIFRGAELVEIPCNKQQAAALGRFVADTFELSQRGEPIDEGPGLYGRSRFFRARGHYHMLRNCNHWSATAMRKLGLDIRPAAAPTVGALFTQVRAAIEERNRE